MYVCMDVARVKINLVQIGSAAKTNTQICQYEFSKVQQLPWYGGYNASQIIKCNENITVNSSITKKLVPDLCLTSQLSSFMLQIKLITGQLEQYF